MIPRAPVAMLAALAENAPAETTASAATNDAAEMRIEATAVGVKMAVSLVETKNHARNAGMSPVVKDGETNAERNLVEKGGEKSLAAKDDGTNDGRTLAGRNVVRIEVGMDGEAVSVIAVSVGRKWLRRRW